LKLLHSIFGPATVSTTCFALDAPRLPLVSDRPRAVGRTSLATGVSELVGDLQRSAAMPPPIGGLARSAADFFSSEFEFRFDAEGATFRIPPDRE
jgi:hypothetical protein